MQRRSPGPRPRERDRATRDRCRAAARTRSNDRSARRRPATMIPAASARPAAGLSKTERPLKRARGSRRRRGTARPAEAETRFPVAASLVSFSRDETDDALALALVARRLWSSNVAGRDSARIRGDREHRTALRGDPLMTRIEPYRARRRAPDARAGECPGRHANPGLALPEGNERNARRVQVIVDDHRFESPPIVGPRGPLPTGAYRFEYLALFNDAWQTPEVLRATERRPRPAGARHHARPRRRRRVLSWSRSARCEPARAATAARRCATAPPAAPTSRRSPTSGTAPIACRASRSAASSTPIIRASRLRDVRVGELDGQIVALARALPASPPSCAASGVPVTGVGSVAVSPEHRRRGIGETLLRAMLREMRQRRPRAVDRSTRSAARTTASSATARSSWCIRWRSRRRTCRPPTRRAACAG